MSDNIAFTPIRGLEQDIRKIDYHEGYIYFAEDSGKIFLDSNNDRTVMGGAGVSVFFAHEDRVSTNIITDVHTLFLKNIEAKEIQPDDLIINTTNGCFYRVINIVDDKVNCYQVAVSGSGGGGGTGPSGSGTIYIEGLEILKYHNVFKYNETDIITIKPVVESNLDVYGTLICEGFIEDKNRNPQKVFSQNINNIPLNQDYDLNLGKILPLYNFSILQFTLTTLNSGSTAPYKFSNINVLDIGLKLDTSGDFIPSEPRTSSEVTIPVIVSGVADKEQLKFYLNDELVKTINLDNSSNERQSYNFKQSMESYFSGLNIIKIDLLLNDIILDTLNIELVWVTAEQNDEPIIWLDSSNQIEGDEYKNVEIRYSIYDPTLPNGTSVEVDYYINDKFIFSDEYILGNTNQFASWITKEYIVNTNNKYTIQYKWGRDKENIIIKDHYIFINKSTINLNYTQQNYFKVAFSPNNRSNSETLRTKTTWTDPYSSILYSNSFNEYFNWIYNGWMHDENFNSILKINNGAIFTIPLDNTYYYNKKGEGNIYNATFEFQFKVSNVKNYKSIIQQITQYQIKYKTNNTEDWIDEDKFDPLTMEKQKNTAGYEIIRVKKLINATNNDVFCSYGQKEGDNFIGFLLSPEEALFSSGESTVNVKYQKDQLITLSFVLGLLNENDSNTINPVRSIKIYLNGVLAGIVTVSQDFFVNSKNIIFNSNICDIDLYNFRFYTTALTMGEIVQNYLADIKDIETYNQNSIFATNNKSILSTNPRINYTNTISYEQLQQYNAQADDDHQSMCYAVITIEENIKDDDISSGRLPVYKGDKKKCSIDFYNPTLDRALSSGKIESFTDAKWYVPSFQATGVEINVQGTSSQGYPRRNFKIKTKNGHLYFNADPEAIDYAADGIYIDDKLNRTNQFTWKIDYMDSSSAHNTGLANLISDFYEDHPLSRYDSSKSYKNTYRTTVYGFPMMVFQKHTYENTDHVDYEFIGKYNFNLDKSSNSYFGFEEKAIQPYVRDNPYSSGAIKYSDIAECWEVKNNQGTWTSFKLGQDNLDTTSDEGLLRIIDFFEYRYLPKRTTDSEGTTILSYTKKGKTEKASWADYLDWAYNYVDPDVAKKEENPSEFNDQTKTQINTNLKLMHKNIYRLIEWLNSVDYLTPSEEELSEPETFIVEEYYMKPDRSGKPNEYEQYDDNLIYYYPIYNSSKSCTELYKVVLDPTTEGYLSYFDGWTKDNFTTWSDKVVFEYDENRSNSFQSYAVEKKFTEDSSDYRKAKFKAEFNKHLDKEYCLVYAALTELLLMYDSRGKNMMLASWGPTEVDGEYIWFPIFYDLDTQLGLNNSGIPTFEYDTDATNDGAFSTSNSVLWNNLYACFKPEILAKYGVLRNNNLTAKKIEQSYEYTPTKSLNLLENSYVQRGVRPLCIHNADEYYKYLAPIATGYWSTNAESDMIKDDGQYLYACQGTRETYRKSLLKNRFNYLDSDWKAGNYAGSSKLQTAIKLRINANSDNTSDFINQKDGPLEANPYFTIEPYLTQYISVLYDKIYSRASSPGKAREPQTPPASSGFEAGFKQDATNFDQQIVYLPGADTVKSFGDLSLKYIEEWFWPTLNNEETINIQDFILGNDENGYYNRKLAELVLSSSVSPKPLLEKVILTGLGSINGLVNAEYCPKLKEFRALGTSISSVSLNEGSVIKTLHLPSTINKLELLNTINLTHMIKTLPARGEKNYQDYQNELSQSGLYLEGLFTPSITSSLNTLSLKNDQLGYQSYEIFSQIMKHYQDDDRTQVKISLININWDPYVIVEKDEELDLTNTSYFQTTIYHTYEQLDNSNQEIIYNLQQQNKLYKQNILSGKAPTSLEDLNICKSKDNIIGLLNNTKPVITGRLFIKNDAESPISAEEIENLEDYYSGLTIQAAYVDKGVTVFYVNEDNTSIAYKNYTKHNENDQSYIEITQLPDSLNPRKDQHTFQYWYIDNNNSEDFFNNVKFRKYYITENEDKIILKPYFLIKNYTINFIFDNKERKENINFFTFNSDALLPTPTPDEIPYLDDSELEDNEENGPRRYKFLGFSSQVHAVTSYSIDATDIPVYYTYSNLNQLPVTDKVDYYAIFQEEYINQVTQADDLEYFYYEKNDLNHTCTIGLVKKLKGKIILPTYTKIPERNSNGEYELSSEYYRITGIIEYSTTTTNNTSSVSFVTNGTNINAIYWYKPSNYPTNTPFQLTIGNKAFYNLSNLQWFDFNTPDIISSIGTSAFENTSLTNSVLKAQSYGNKCFYTGFKRSELDSSGISVVNNKISILEIQDGQTSMGTNMIYGWPSNDDSSFEEYELQKQYFLKLGSSKNPYRGGSSVFASLRKAIRYISEIYWQKNDADTQVTSLQDLMAKLESFDFENTLVHRGNISIYYTEDNGQNWDSVQI